VSGRQRTKAIVLTPPTPTALQSLVGKVSQTLGERELYELHQPIDGAEFDGSWRPVWRCEDRLEIMLKFLSGRSLLKPELSVLDLTCFYGWFVAEFAKRGCCVVGVDSNPTALKIGQIAYGLKTEQLIYRELLAYLAECDRKFEVVLLLSIRQDFLPESDFGSAKEVLERVDPVTRSVLFLDTGQSHERWFRHSLPEWDNSLIMRFIQENTSFNHVISLGVDSPILVVLPKILGGHCLPVSARNGIYVDIGTPDDLMKVVTSEIKTGYSLEET